MDKRSCIDLIEQEVLYHAGLSPAEKNKMGVDAKYADGFVDGLEHSLCILRGEYPVFETEIKGDTK